MKKMLLVLLFVLSVGYVYAVPPEPIFGGTPFLAADLTSSYATNYALKNVKVNSSGELVVQGSTTTASSTSISSGTVNIKGNVTANVDGSSSTVNIVGNVNATVSGSSVTSNIVGNVDTTVSSGSVNIKGNVVANVDGSSVTANIAGNTTVTVSSGIGSIIGNVTANVDGSSVTVNIKGNTNVTISSVPVPVTVDVRSGNLTIEVSTLTVDGFIADNYIYRGIQGSLVVSNTIYFYGYSTDYYLKMIGSTGTIKSSFDVNYTSAIFNNGDIIDDDFVIPCSSPTYFYIDLSENCTVYYRVKGFVR